MLFECVGWQYIQIAFTDSTSKGQCVVVETNVNWLANYYYYHTPGVLECRVHKRPDLVFM